MYEVVRRAARPAELVVGVVFLAGALLKAAYITNFSIQIYAYGVIEDKSLLPVVAFSTLSIELLLGCALTLGLRWRALSYAALEALLVLFTGLILYGWRFNNLENCGCFGPLEISPGASIAKNLVLLLLGAFAWMGRLPDTPRSRRTTLKAAASLALSGAVILYAGRTFERAEGVFSQFVFDTEDGLHFDLGKGEYLVAMLSMSCKYCMQEVPALNTLFQSPGLPPMVALCLEENPGDMDEFRAGTNPQFPMHNLGNRPMLYFKFIEKETFRFYFIRNGRPVKFWDARPPDYDEIIATIHQRG